MSTTVKTLLAISFVALAAACAQQEEPAPPPVVVEQPTGKY
jgi:hypothetical protein